MQHNSSDGQHLTTHEASLVQRGEGGLEYQVRLYPASFNNKKHCKPNGTLKPRRPHLQVVAVVVVVCVKGKRKDYRCACVQQNRKFILIGFVAQCQACNDYHADLHTTLIQ